MLEHELLQFFFLFQIPLFGSYVGLEITFLFFPDVFRTIDTIQVTHFVFTLFPFPRPFHDKNSNLGNQKMNKNNRIYRDKNETKKLEINFFNKIVG